MSVKRLLFCLTLPAMLATTALAQRGLFDDGEGAKTALDETGRKLADDVLDSVNDSYSKVANYCIRGFTAEYDIVKGEAPVGSMHVAIDNRKDGRYEVKLLGQAAQDRWLETNLRDCWLYTIAGERRKHISSARQTADGYEFAYNLDPNLYRQYKLYVDREFRLLREEQVYKDGARVETLFATQSIGGKHYVESVTVRVLQDNDVDELRNELSYRLEDGVPFIRKMALARTRTGRPAETYTATLKKVQFEQETDLEVLGEDAKLWDDLSKKVISRIMGNEVGMETIIRFVKSFECNVLVRVTVGTGTPGNAKIRLAWDDKDGNGILVGEEVEGKVQYMSSQNMQLYLEEIRQDLVKRAMEGRTSLFLKHEVSAAQTDEGYLMKLVPVKKPTVKEEKVDGETVRKVGPPGYDTAYLTVSPDFRIQRIRALLGNENQTLIEYEYEKFGPGWLPSRFTMLSSGDKKARTVTKVQLTYRTVDKTPVLEKSSTEVNITDLGARAVHLQTEMTFEDVKVEKRQRPLHPLALRGTIDEQRIFKKLEAEKEAKKALEGKKGGQGGNKDDKGEKKVAVEVLPETMTDAELARAIDEQSNELVALKAANAPRDRQDEAMARLRKLIQAQNLRETNKGGKKTD